MFTPWSVFQDGCNQLPSLQVISLLSIVQRTKFFPSQYLCAIGTLLYLVLDGLYHLFTLHYQAGLLMPPVVARACNPPWAGIPACSTTSFTTHPKGGLPSGLFPGHSPLPGESSLISAPSHSDMLKFRECPGSVPIRRRS